MKEKITAMASEMFLKLGFKSITMDDIAAEMCISKKTIYKYFNNKEVLIAESTLLMNQKVKQIVADIQSSNYNAIEENFKLHQTLKGLLQTTENSPLYQLKKHYSQIYNKVSKKEFEDILNYLQRNADKGIQQGYYRPEIANGHYHQLYFLLSFSINENTQSEKEARILKIAALEYHIRAMATPKGILELERQLSILNSNQ